MSQEEDNTPIPDPLALRREREVRGDGTEPVRAAILAKVMPRITRAILEVNNRPQSAENITLLKSQLLPSPKELAADIRARITTFHPSVVTIDAKTPEQRIATLVTIDMLADYVRRKLQERSTFYTVVTGKCHAFMCDCGRDQGCCDCLRISWDTSRAPVQ